jgi:hypothetical protein
MILVDLGNGLIVRYPTAADADELCAFNAEMHGAPGPPDEGIKVWTRDLLTRPHPTFTPQDFTVIEDRRSGRIISSLNLISQTWTYGGIPFGVGQVEIVATSPEYRRRGLVRKQFEIVHEWSAQRGELVTVVSGIPWYYRQFGYEYALEHDGGRTCYAANIPALPKDTPEPFRLRTATLDDIPLIARLDEAARPRYLVTAARDAAMWRYELEGRSERNGVGRAFQIVEPAAGAPIGYLAHVPVRRGPIMAVTSLELEAGVSWPAVMPSVLRGLRAIGEKKHAPEAEPFGGIAFMLGTEHPLYRAIPDRVPRVVPPYAWYVRVPDLAAFVRHVTPVLEARLAASEAAGYSGELKLCFFRSGLWLHLVEGRIETDVWLEPHYQDGDALFPDLTFLQLLFGYRSLDEIEYAFPDAGTRKEMARVLLNALFPKLPSLVWQIS